MKQRLVVRIDLEDGPAGDHQAKQLAYEILKTVYRWTDEDVDQMLEIIGQEEVEVPSIYDLHEAFDAGIKFSIEEQSAPEGWDKVEGGPEGTSLEQETEAGYDKLASGWVGTDSAHNHD